MSSEETRIAIPKDLKESLQRLATDLGKPLEYIILTALEKYIHESEESEEPE